MSRINKWILDDENEVDFEDAEAVNQTDGELNDTIVTYEGNTSDVQSWTDFIASFVNGMKIGKFFKNLYAGIQYVLHVGSLVNNCVSENTDMPLAAAQGKVLMDLINESNDEITQLKSDLTELSDEVDNKATGGDVVMERAAVATGATITVDMSIYRFGYLLGNRSDYYCLIGFDQWGGVQTFANNNAVSVTNSNEVVSIANISSASLPYLLILLKTW